MERTTQLAYATVGNYEDAKDIAQDAFVKAHGALLRFEMKSSFSTWMYRILMNTAKDFSRKKKWKRFLTWKDREAMDNYFENIADPNARPGSGVMNQELGLHMTQMIKKLPFKQQWVFTLRFIEGLSLSEISEAAHISQGTVKATLHFAVQKFKNGIEPYVSGKGVFQ